MEGTIHCNLPLNRPPALSLVAFVGSLATSQEIRVRLALKEVKMSEPTRQATREYEDVKSCIHKSERTMEDSIARLLL